MEFLRDVRTAAARAAIMRPNPFLILKRLQFPVYVGHPQVGPVIPAARPGAVL